MTPTVLRDLRRVVVLATALVLLLTGCVIRETRAEQTLVSQPIDRVAVLLTNQAQPPGTTTPQQLFTSGLEQRTLTHQVEVSDSAQAQLAQLRDVRAYPVVIVQPWPDQQVSDELRQLKESGTLVIAVLNRPQRRADVSLVVGWDDFGGGERQFATLLAAMQQQRPAESHNVEHTAGDTGNWPDRLRFNGSMWALKPFGKAGTIATKTGQTSWSQVTSPNDDQGYLAKRLRTTLEATYPEWPLDGVITGSPAEAATVLEVVSGAGKKQPVVVTDGVSHEVMQRLGDGTLAGTLYRDPALVVDRALTALDAIKAGQPLVLNPHVSYHNRYHLWYGQVPALLVTPPVLTKATAAEVLADNPDLLKELR